MKFFDEKLFRATRKKAASILNDTARVKTILTAAQTKADSHKSRLKAAFADLKSLIELLGAWAKGEYRHVPWATLISALAAVIYFVNPFDLVSDFLAGFGLLDDAVVISYVLSYIKTDLERFSQWKKERENTIVIS